jgi:hypothetical protein
MYVFLTFLKKNDLGELTEMFFGDYSFVDILLVDNQNIVVYRTRPGENYTRHPLRKDLMVKLEYFTKQSVFLQVEVTDEEFEKLCKTCVTFSTVTTPFNRKDYLLYYIPIRIPDEIPLFQARTLSDSQAAILFLRECLSTAHRIAPLLQNINSRHSLPETLYNTLAPVCPLVEWNQLCPMLPWSA